MFANKEIINAALNSLLLAVSASTLATVFGSIMTLVLTRYRFIGRRILNGSVYLLTISPDIVMGISLLIIFIFFPILFALAYIFDNILIWIKKRFINK